MCEQYIRERRHPKTFETVYHLSLKLAYHDSWRWYVWIFPELLSLQALFRLLWEDEILQNSWDKREKDLLTFQSQDFAGRYSTASSRLAHRNTDASPYLSDDLAPLDISDLGEKRAQKILWNTRVQITNVSVKNEFKSCIINIATC